MPFFSKVSIWHLEDVGVPELFEAVEGVACRSKVIVRVRRRVLPREYRHRCATPDDPRFRTSSTCLSLLTWHAGELLWRWLGMGMGRMARTCVVVLALPLVEFPGQFAALDLCGSSPHIISPQRQTRPPPMPDAKRTRQRTRRFILPSTSSTRGSYSLTPSPNQGKSHPHSAALFLRSVGLPCRGQ